MSTIKTMTLDELQKMPPLTEQEKAIIKNAEPVYSTDCPKQSAEELRGFQPWYKAYSKKDETVTQKDIHLKLDSDILDALKMESSCYQTRINEILRKAVFGNA